MPRTIPRRLASAGEDPFRDEYTDEVQAALDQLPRELRETLLLVVVGELTHQEAADLLDVPLGTVLSRVSRGGCGCVSFWGLPRIPMTRWTIDRNTAMTDGPFEPTIDSLLNELAVPAGLVPRLHDIANLSDDELDVRLRDIGIPAGLVERLQWLVADEELDAGLRSVTIPVSVLPRTRNIPHVRRRSRLRQWALAASLMVMVGAGLTALLGSMVSSIRPVPPPPLAMVVIDQGPLGPGDSRGICRWRSFPKLATIVRGPARRG